MFATNPCDALLRFSWTLVVLVAAQLGLHSLGKCFTIRVLLQNVQCASVVPHPAHKTEFFLLSQHYSSSHLMNFLQMRHLNQPKFSRGSHRKLINKLTLPVSTAPQQSLWCVYRTSIFQYGGFFFLFFEEHEMLATNHVTSFLRFAGCAGCAVESTYWGNFFFTIRVFLQFTVYLAVRLISCSQNRVLLLSQHSYWSHLMNFLQIHHLNQPKFSRRINYPPLQKCFFLALHTTGLIL